MWQVWFLPEELETDLLKAACKFIKREWKKNPKNPKRGLCICLIKKEKILENKLFIKHCHASAEVNEKIIPIGASSRQAIMVTQIICPKPPRPQQG